MDVMLLRHGACTHDAVKRYVGQIDYPLTSYGLEQTRAWQGFFARTPPARVISSDLTRAVQTAQSVCAQIPIHIHQEPALRELSLGEWEGMPHKEVRRRFPRAYAQRGKALSDFRPPGGESFSDLYQRVIPWLTSLVEQGNPSLLLVTHAGVIRIILCHILGIDLHRLFMFRIDYAKMVRLHKGLSGWVVRKMNSGPSE